MSFTRQISILVDVFETRIHFNSFSSVNSLSMMVCIFNMVFNGVLMSWEVDAIIMFDSFSMDFAYSV